MKLWRAHRETAFFGIVTVALLVGTAAYLAGQPSGARWIWLVVTLGGLLQSTASTLAAVRRRRASVDVIALLALVGALLVDEPFAGALITMMLASGTLLEARAAARARRELSLLVQRAPRTARRRDADTLNTVPIDAVRHGDRLLVGTGEVVPVDGRLLSAGVFDESALSGEAMPVERDTGDDVRSGVVNLAQPVDLVATALAAQSTYAGVVRLVEQAQASTAPFVRAADRFAIGFVPLTLALAGLAWLLSGDPVRAVAVLVVATPCPLLLATDLHTAPADLVARYAARWAIEVTFFDTRQTLGVGQARKRTAQAVNRTWAFGMYTTGITTVDPTPKNVLASCTA